MARWNQYSFVQYGKRRKELHLTQQQLADQLHVTRQTLSRWEKI
ncbi:hypothetical protein C1940_17115 (plasmid) [Lactiplantibacillus plantarum subsp. plantarum]|nr:hypothetical protein C1940_17115 [Lactiplantibacillus plantarum subsp. plantarum]